MSNERLRAAMQSAGLTLGALSEAAGVDPKTCERWVTQGRTPHRVNASRAAVALREDVSYLWPDIELGRRQQAMHPDLIAMYSSRADAPLGIWRALFEQAEHDIGILVYAAVFVHELWPDFRSLLQEKATSGCRVRVLLGDPACDAVTRRGNEEKYGHGIASRCEQALMYYEPLIGLQGAEIHQHDTTLYNSIYRGDEMMVVNTHRFGMNAHATPALHLRRAAPGGIFDGYAESFEDVWRLSWPAKAR
ncbi:MAG: helix-turn-helix domain-containing protein [Actinomycetota bacterium]|nr:helix-turn-helix domain-containing protein [Actinomycetota bacterium]